VPRSRAPILAAREPSSAEIARFLAEQDGTSPVADADVDAPPAGFDADHASEAIGSGPADFDAARGAIAAWGMFPSPLSRIVPPDAPILVGTTVAVLLRGPGFWLLNACRIVRTIDESDRFGFVYATLPAHIEAGAERFLVTIDRSTRAVVYDLRAYSRPSHWLACIGKPVVRAYQARFRRESPVSMRAAVRALQDR
jgi:uncharacterized protein (UPF0548 family)